MEQKHPQTALIILDGWGYREELQDNAVAQAKTPHFDQYWKEYPHTLLEASGLAVGLPEGQVGNSEIGHMTIGAGRSLDTDLVRIAKSIAKNDTNTPSKAVAEGDNSIQDPAFGTQHAFETLFHHVTTHHSAIHVLGLLGTGGVHAHQDHLIAFLKVCKERGIGNVYLHVFTDGRDTAPQSSATFLTQLEQDMKEIGVGKIATMSGRFYAMDRDNNWDRLAKTEAALFDCQGATCSLTPAAHVTQLHADGVYDEHMEPVVVVEELTNEDGTTSSNTYGIGMNDGVFLFNFRADRARMITERVLARKESLNLCIATMTEYSSKYDVLVAFPPQVIRTTLAQEVSLAGLSQAHIAETEKFPHATYFLNGGKETPHDKEEHVLLASRKDVQTHDQAPKMRAEAIADEAIARINAGVDFIFINFANPDMVGHTANVPALIEAVEETDTQMQRVVAALTARNGVAIITADHGNAEVNVEASTGAPHTSHTLNKVPCIITKQGLTLQDGGDLTCLAPTTLALLGLTPPTDMTGTILFITNDK